MTRQDYENLYNESIELIKSTPNLTTKTIPDHLLKVWLYNGQALENPPSFELLFATSIYQYANDLYGNENYIVDSRKFERFQNILATEYVCREVKAKLRPFRVFNFKGYDQALNVDIKRNQVKKYMDLAARIIPLNL